MLETGGLEETHSCLHPALAVACEPTCQFDAALTPGLSQDSFAALGQSRERRGQWAAGGPGCAAACCCAAKIAAYQQQYADNQNISFLPAIVSTSTRMHGEFLRLLLQAHRETEAHFTAVGMSSQNINTGALLFKRAAFYNGLKSKVGLAAAKAAALRINLNVQGCGIVAPPMHAPSRTPLLLPLLLSHNLPTPRVH